MTFNKKEVEALIARLNSDNPVGLKEGIIETMREGASTLTAMLAEIELLEKRLEANDDGWDGIRCRNETIKHLEGQLAAVITERDALKTEAAAKQAQIDRLMFEFCSDDMTEEQVERFANSCKAVSIDAAMKKEGE